MFPTFASTGWENLKKAYSLYHFCLTVTFISARGMSYYLSFPDRETQVQGILIHNHMDIEMDIEW